MRSLDLNRRKIGINFISHTEIEILLWAPYAKNKVEILINDKECLQLNKSDFGYWSLKTDKIINGDEYVFILDGDKNLSDPASLSQPKGVHGPSQAIDLNNFKWTDNDWNNLSLKNYLFYELHTGTFSNEGTFKGVEKKLDYLIDLGITAIEIMPVAQFPGDRNWGYDGVFPFAVQNTYGGSYSFQNLINLCHQKGLAVVLDVVYNHMGPEGNFFENFGKYFTEKYKTPWGSAINYDDAWCDEIRYFFIENVLMWFRDFHIDALRMDAVHAIKDFSPKHILEEIREKVNQLEKKTGKTHHLIIECDLNDKRFINQLSEGGYGIDAQWSDEFHHALRVTAGQEKKGYYMDFNGIKDLAKCYESAYVYTGQYSKERFKNFGTDPKNNPGEQFVVFSQNHDQIGNRMQGERTSKLNTFEMQKLLAAAVFISPFLPLLFMGEEICEPNPFLYFISHEDSELVEAVRKGRKEEFLHFHHDGEVPDPFSEETYNNSKIQWELINVEPHQTMFKYYQSLIKLRKENLVLNDFNRNNIKTNFNESDNTLVIERWNDQNSIICFMNFSEEIRSFTISDSQIKWIKIFDSADIKWKGNSTSPDIAEINSIIQIQPESLTIYSKNNV